MNTVTSATARPLSSSNMLLIVGCLLEYSRCPPAAAFKNGDARCSVQIREEEIQNEKEIKNNSF